MHVYYYTYEHITVLGTASALTKCCSILCLHSYAGEGRKWLTGHNVDRYKSTGLTYGVVNRTELYQYLKEKKVEYSFIHVTTYIC